MPLRSEAIANDPPSDASGDVIGAVGSVREARERLDLPPNSNAASGSSNDMTDPQLIALIVTVSRIELGSCRDRHHSPPPCFALDGYPRLHEWRVDRLCRLVLRLDDRTGAPRPHVQGVQEGQM